jgi:hypothetical protein
VEKKVLKRLEAFKEEFGKVLDPVAFIKEKMKNCVMLS